MMPGHQGEKEERPKKEAMRLQEKHVSGTKMTLEGRPGEETGGKKRGEAVSVGGSSAAVARRPCWRREDGSWPVATSSAPAHRESDATLYTGADEHAHVRTCSHTRGCQGPAV